MQDYTKLRVWQRAHQLSVAVFEMTSRRPARGSAGLASQVRRAVWAIAANIAEGTGQSSAAQFARYLHIAIGSASEAATHMLLMRDLRLISPAEWSDVNERIRVLRAMLIVLLRRVQEREARERDDIA